MYRSPRRLFSHVLSLPSNLKKYLRRKLLSLLDIQVDVKIKDSSNISFVGDYIGGGVEFLDCEYVTFSNCTITAPPGTTPMVVRNAPGGAQGSISHSHAISPPVLAFPPPSKLPAVPTQLPVIQRPTPIVGFRGWRVSVEKPEGLRLGSTAVGFHWSVATNVAACMSADGAVADHSAPMADCECGLYLMRRLEDVADYTGENVVYGAVVSWGRIIEHTDGFRAEFARPLALVKDSPLAETVGDVLGLPVVARGYLENYAKEFGEGLTG